MADFRKNHITCLIRKKACSCTPEEEVRQSILQILCCEKGFPRSLCSVEISLELLSKEMAASKALENTSNRFVQKRGVYRRRIDILFSRYDELKSHLLPFFLIECKAGSSGKEKYSTLSKLALRQLLGYRATLGSVPFFALAFHNEIVIWSDVCGFHKPWYAGPAEDMPRWEEFQSLVL